MRTKVQNAVIPGPRIHVLMEQLILFSVNLVIFPALTAESM